MHKKNILRILLATVVILLVPFVAMQFTTEMPWSVFDFVVAGVLLFGTGLAYEFVASRAGNIVHKMAVGLAVGAALLLIWVNLAVGIIGSEDNPANVMYLGVLAVEFIGAMIVGFKPRGMARAMFATAAAQALVAVITLVASFTTGTALTKTLFVNCFFVVLWVGAGLLFRRANETVPTV
jgi:hypothetical protein